jgi:hypothetical protein
MSPRRLSAWVRRRLSDSHYIALYYIPQGGEDELVATWNLKEELKDSTDDQIAEIVVASAQDDCDCREMECRYSVRTLDTSKEQIASTVVKQRPQDAPVDPLDIGPAATNSAISQLVRMNEVQLRLQVQSWGQVINGYNTLISAQQNELAMMRKREAKAAEIIEQATMRALEVDERDTEENLAISRLAEFAERIAPIVLEKLNIPSLDPQPVVGPPNGHT